jgi:hypothetical protein
VSIQLLNKKREKEKKKKEKKGASLKHYTKAESFRI